MCLSCNSNGNFCETLAMEDSSILWATGCWVLLALSGRKKKHILMHCSELGFPVWNGFMRRFLVHSCFTTPKESLSLPLLCRQLVSIFSNCWISRVFWWLGLMFWILTPKYARFCALKWPDMAILDSLSVWPV